MIAAVIPAQNEEKRIGQVLDTVCALNVAPVYVVINGSTDRTLQEVQHFASPKIQTINMDCSLGIDVPRAIGAYAAHWVGADGVLFVDGDMIGDISPSLSALIWAIEANQLDLALTNCYPDAPYGPPYARELILCRKQLNTILGIFPTIGVASPSHGPHALSRALLKTVPFSSLAVPPVMLALAVKARLRVGVATSIPHATLGSSLRDPTHGSLITDTIIGDSLAATRAFYGLPQDRSENGRDYDGYHSFRRFDLLRQFALTFTACQLAN